MRAECREGPGPFTKKERKEERGIFSSSYVTRCDVAVVGRRGKRARARPPAARLFFRLPRRPSPRRAANSSPVRRAGRQRGPPPDRCFGFVPSSAAVVGGQAGWFSQWQQIKYGGRAAARRAPVRIPRAYPGPATVRRRRADIRFSSLDCAVRSFTRSFSR